MKTGKRYKIFTLVSAVCLLIISLLIKLASYFPLWVEKNYSRGIYPHIAWFYRSILGWIPVSLGDLLYAAAGVFLLITLIQFVKILARRGFELRNFRRSLKKLFFIAVSIYVYFNLSWGLNYNRPGIAYQLNLSPQTENTNELRLVTSLLVKKVNESRKMVGNDEGFLESYRNVFGQAQVAYSKASVAFPFLQYETISVKRSMYGKMGNFLGFLGYYNPFTGEAQVNLTQPRFLVPFVSCHEIAHQLGYASESEANFVGYLAAANSGNTIFHYSAYFDLFNYANQELYMHDSTAAKNNYKLLDPLVKKDEQELRDYWRKSDNIIEPLVKIFYDHYLKANQQTKGMKSYNEVVGWLIAYYKKYGKM
jgi:hypothetical protein